MRIVITSPPKTGNKWLKCLLATIYGLDWVLGDDTPATTPAAFRRWMADGGFKDGWIFHQHCKYTPNIARVIEAAPAHIVTIVRDPYDQFVSLYYWLQSRAAHDEARQRVRLKERPRDTLIGKPLDHPDVLTYLAEEFPNYLVKANDWAQSGRSTVVRYEDLHRDPIGELKRVTDQIQPVDEERIARALKTCSAENMRQMSTKMAQHIRSAKVGDSKQALGEAHLAIFREKHADLVRSLGYEVR